MAENETTENSGLSLIETGRIIIRSGEIENRLRELGGSGSGLREKAESVPGGLPPELMRRLAELGAVRNKVAHGDDVSDEEIARFHETADLVTEALDAVSADTEAKPKAKPKPKTGSAPSPADRRPSPREEKAASVIPLAVVPLAHLVYAAGRIGSGLFAAAVPLALIVLEALSWCGIGYGVMRHSLPAALAGGALLAASSAAAVTEALRLPPDTRGAWWRFALPAVNFGWFLYRAAVTLGWLALFEGSVILGVWAAAVLLAVRGEWRAAFLVGGVSYAVSVGVWLHSRTGVA